jgi:hypothetical protein
MSQRGLALALLVLFSVVPTTVAVDRRLSGFARPRSPWLVSQALSTACPFRRLPWLCHPPAPGVPVEGVAARLVTVTRAPVAAA